MSELLELQRRFAAAVMHPLTKNETMPHRRRDGVANNAEAVALIKPNDRLNSFERLRFTTANTGSVSIRPSRRIFPASKPSWAAQNSTG